MNALVQLYCVGGNLNTQRKICSSPTLSHHKFHITWLFLEPKPLQWNKLILVHVTLKNKPSFVKMHIFYYKYFVLYKNLFWNCTPIKLSYLTSRPPGYCSRVSFWKYVPVQTNMFDRQWHQWLKDQSTMGRYLFDAMRNQIQLHSMKTGKETTEWKVLCWKHYVTFAYSSPFKVAMFPLDRNKLFLVSHT